MAFSIEIAADEIPDIKTRQYFQEVLGSYINGNNRSAVVMLWSVVVSDLIYKLQLLRDIYNDEVAEDILTNLEKKQQNDSKSPKWELELLEEIKRRTELLDNSEYENMLYLQKVRHLSAHPILGSTDLLFSPNKESVRALIRNSLEAVLLKPPVLTKKIAQELLEDIAANQELLIDDQSLKRYLETKYLANLRADTEQHIFRTLWKLVFRTVNPDTDRNLNVNVRVLKIIYARNRHSLRSYIQNDVPFFSEIGGDDARLKNLLLFLSENYGIYEVLSDSARVLLENSAQSSLSRYAVATFLSKDVETHLEGIKSKLVLETRIDQDDKTVIHEEPWNHLVRVADEHGATSTLCDIAVLYYTKSNNFNTADEFYKRYIKKLLQSFSGQQLHYLLDGIEVNGQTYNRGASYQDHEEIRDRVYQVLGEDFEASKYPAFNGRLDQ